MSATPDITQIVTWLIAGAPPHGTHEGFIAALATRLNAAGFPIDSFGLSKYNIHPMFPAEALNWSKKRGVQKVSVPNVDVQTDAFQNAANATVIRQRKGLRFRFKEEDDQHSDFFLKPYVRAGYTDLIGLPLFNVGGTVTRCIFLGTRHPQGFDADTLDKFRRLQSPVARICEHFGDSTDMQVALATYLGQEVGRKVLMGKIRRGDGEAINAVIMFVDLVGYTDLSNRLAGPKVLQVLNDFFEVINTSVVANYGEILKFLGDGALIVFPVFDDLTAQEAAARGALNAVAQARAALLERPDDTRIEFRASLHVGEFFYGNIGSQDRLDFTAVGPAVNLASRLLDQASTLDAKTVCSAAFNELTQDTAHKRAECALKGFEVAVPVFVID